MSGQSTLAERAGALRLAFDTSFAQEARRDATPMENLLGLRLGPEPYALRLSEIGGLFVDRKVTQVPGGVAGLLGIAGFRGAVIPVYDLHVLLGRIASETPRWLVVAKDASVALAFETFVGHLHVPRQAILPRDAGEHSSRLVREFASVGDRVQPVVHLPSVLDAIREQSPSTSKGERS
jgi:chemotaxis signal transduction protein